LRGYRCWIPVGILLVPLIVGGVAPVIGMQAYDRAISDNGSLGQSMSLASKVADQVVAVDSEDAKARRRQPHSSRS
jgi:hypothetical protein